MNKKLHNLTSNIDIVLRDEKMAYSNAGLNLVYYGIVEQ